MCGKNTSLAFTNFSSGLQADLHRLRKSWHRLPPPPFTYQPGTSVHSAQLPHTERTQRTASISTKSELYQLSGKIHRDSVTTEGRNALRCFVIGSKTFKPSRSSAHSSVFAGHVSVGKRGHFQPPCCVHVVLCGVEPAQNGPFRG